MSLCLKVKQQCLGMKIHKLISDVATSWNSAYDMVERFLEKQPAISANLLSPEVRKAESDLCTLTETNMTNAEDAVRALKPMKDSTTLMSEERNPAVSRCSSKCATPPEYVSRHRRLTHDPQDQECNQNRKGLCPGSAF